MNINNKTELDAAIIGLQKKKSFQEAELKYQFKVTRESLRPLNLVKDGFKKLREILDLQDILLKTASGVSAAFLSKKMIGGKSSSIVKKILGSVVEFFVAKTAVENTDKIKAFGTSVYNNFFKKKEKQGK